MLISFPHSPGSGGPGSFQARFEAELGNRGWQVEHGPSVRGTLPDVIFVVGGTRKLPWLAKIKRRGVPIVYRLDGLLWLHRLKGFGSTPSKWLGAEFRNIMAQIIHSRLADSVVYQSEFVREWWSKAGWQPPKCSYVIHNGVDIKEFRPSSVERARTIVPRLVAVEGHIDYSPYAIDFLNHIARQVKGLGGSLFVYGGFSDPSNRFRLDDSVQYCGSVSREAVADVYRDRIFLSLDVNPACPNSVVEALASGAPVIGFDTGSVKELVGDKAGVIAPFGGDPWKGDNPDFASLVEAYRRIVGDFKAYSDAARSRAEKCYDVRKMVDDYIVVIEKTIR